MSDILEGIEGAECQVEDIIIHGCDQAQHDERLHSVLKRLAEAIVTSNLSKCEFSITKVKVPGHVVSAEGISADPQKIEAIRILPTPKNAAEVRSFLSMVNHVSKFAEHLTSKTNPLRELLKKKNSWHWGYPQEQAFRGIKEMMTSAPILALYDTNKDTKVNADASSYGIGGIVMQKQDDGIWKPISYVSRALSPAESADTAKWKESA